jgi:hypothetical protein
MTDSCFDRLVETYGSSVRADLPSPLPGEHSIYAMVNFWVNEKKTGQGRITFNEIESMFYAINLIAISNAFHLYQAKDASTDEFVHHIVKTDNYGPINRQLETIKNSDGLVDRVFVCFWDESDKKKIADQESDDYLLSLLEQKSKLIYSFLFSVNFELILKSA